MSRFDNEMLAAIEIILEEKILFEIRDIKRQLQVISNQIYNLKPKPQDLKIVIIGDKGEVMADLVLQQGESKTAILHYLDGNGADMGQVPAGDSPTFSASDPHLTVSMNSDGTAVVSNANTGNADVDVVLTGSAKGFSKDKTVTCTGIGGGGGQPPQPAGVDIQFQ